MLGPGARPQRASRHTQESRRRTFPAPIPTHQGPDTKSTTWKQRSERANITTMARAQVEQDVASRMEEYARSWSAPEDGRLRSRKSGELGASAGATNVLAAQQQQRQARSPAAGSSLLRSVQRPSAIKSKPEAPGPSCRPKTIDTAAPSLEDGGAGTRQARPKRPKVLYLAVRNRSGTPNFSVNRYPVMVQRRMSTSRRRLEGTAS